MQEVRIIIKQIENWILMALIYSYDNGCFWILIYFVHNNYWWILMYWCLVRKILKGDWDYELLPCPYNFQISLCAIIHHGNFKPRSPKKINDQKIFENVSLDWFPRISDYKYFGVLSKGGPGSDVGISWIYKTGHIYSKALLQELSGKYFCNWMSCRFFLQFWSTLRE